MEDIMKIKLFLSTAGALSALFAGQVFAFSGASGGGDLPAAIRACNGRVFGDLCDTNSPFYQNTVANETIFRDFYRCVYREVGNQNLSDILGGSKKCANIKEDYLAYESQYSNTSIPQSVRDQANRWLPGGNQAKTYGQTQTISPSAISAVQQKPISQTAAEIALGRVNAEKNDPVAERARCERLCDYGGNIEKLKQCSKDCAVFNIALLQNIKRQYGL